MSWLSLGEYPEVFHDLLELGPLSWFLQIIAYLCIEVSGVHNDVLPLVIWLYIYQVLLGKDVFLLDQSNF